MTAFIFVPLLAGTCIVGALVWLYAARVFTVIVENTAAGNVQIVWDDESFLDWATQGVVLAWHVAVWAVPVVLITASVTPGLDETWRGAVILVVAALGVWVMPPVGVLSSMAAESRWSVLSLHVLGKLWQHAGDWLAYQLWTAPAMALALGAIGWAWRRPGMASFVGAGIVLTFAWVTTARLLGNLGYRLLGRVGRRRPKNKPLPTARQVTASRSLPEPTEPDTPIFSPRRPMVQPSELPPIESPYDGPITGYDVRFEDDLPAPAETPAERSSLPRTRSAEDDALPLAHEKVDPSRSRVICPAAVPPDRLEMERRKRVAAAPLGWTDGRLWLFVTETKTATQIVVLGAGCALVGGMVEWLRVLWPT